MVNRHKSARGKGYRLERECCLFYRNLGAFAMRIPSRAQKGILRPIDVIAYYNKVFYIIQCKYQKKYLHKEEIERILLAATQFSATALLCYRDQGLKFEPLPFQ